MQDLYAPKQKSNPPQSAITPPTTMPTIFIAFEIGDFGESVPVLEVEVKLEVADAEGADVGIAPGRTKLLSVQLNSSQ